MYFAGKNMYFAENPKYYIEFPKYYAEKTMCFIEKSKCFVRKSMHHAGAPTWCAAPFYSFSIKSTSVSVMLKSRTSGRWSLKPPR